MSAATPKKRPGSVRAANPKQYGSSRIANLPFLVEGEEIDGRSVWARSFRTYVQRHIDDLGGLDHMSQAQITLARRAATMAVELEIMETKLAEGGEGVDLDLYSRVAGHQSRILERLGIKKVEQRSKDFLEVVAEIGKGNRVA